MSDRASYLVETGEIGARLSLKYGVTADIHRDDPVFSHLYGLHGRDLDRALHGYLEQGRTSAERIRDLIAELQGATIVDGKIVDRMTLLDFGSGYGCVARHVVHLIPQAKLVAIDPRDKAMYFNTLHIGVQAAVADPHPVRVDPFFQFDVVFALSFLSSMPRNRIGPWLQKLVQFTKSGGILIFTMNGKTAHRDHLAHLTISGEGHAFEKAVDPSEIAIDGYGTAVAYPSLIFRELDLVKNVDIVVFRSGVWSDHQDLYVVRKTA